MGGHVLDGRCAACWDCVMPRTIARRWLFCALLLWALTGVAAAEKRVALVIGNSDYRGVTYLKNPIRDAKAIGEKLIQIGFDSVEVATDLSGDAMRRSFFEFEKKASSSDVAVIYFAGHGIEVGGMNYLLPTDAENLSNATIGLQAISLDNALGTIAGARQLKLVLLDACRDNPFIPKIRAAGASRSVGRGLARAEPSGRQTAIAYAARDGMTAADGDGEHSPFSSALLRYLAEPLDIRLVFGLVRDDVMHQTKEQQEPFLYASLGGQQVILAPPKATTGLPPLEYQNAVRPSPIPLAPMSAPSVPPIARPPSPAPLQPQNVARPASPAAPISTINTQPQAKPGRPALQQQPVARPSDSPPAPTLRTAKAIECSRLADAKGLHGIERRDFRAKCKQSGQ
jgi:hypothetical protein